MPATSLKLGLRYAVIGTLLASAVLASAVLAAEPEATQAAESFGALAERFGLWAALCVLLVLGAVWALYQETKFVQRTLVELVTRNQAVITALIKALEDAPCGREQRTSKPYLLPDPDAEIGQTLRPR